MDRGAWRAAVHRVTKSQTQLSDWHTHIQCVYTRPHKCTHPAWLGQLHALTAHHAPPLCGVFSAAPKSGKHCLPRRPAANISEFLQWQLPGIGLVRWKDFSCVGQWGGPGLLVRSPGGLLEISPLSSTLAGRRMCGCSGRGDIKRRKDGAMTDFSWVPAALSPSINNGDPSLSESPFPAGPRLSPTSPSRGVMARSRPGSLLWGEDCFA